MAGSFATTTQEGQGPSEAPPPSHFRSTLPVPGAAEPGNADSSATTQHTGLNSHLSGHGNRAR